LAMASKGWVAIISWMDEGREGALELTDPKSSSPGEFFLGYGFSSISSKGQVNQI
jgi:hypothetical protein